VGDVINCGRAVEAQPFEHLLSQSTDNEQQLSERSCANYPEGSLEAMKAAIPVIAQSGKLEDEVMQNMSTEVLWQIVRQGNKDLSPIAKKYVSPDPN
jgi:hypothetical protein